MAQLIDLMLKGEPDMEQLNMDMPNMEFDFDAPDMMTSDFFDSVMSMEKENFLDTIDESSIKYFNDDLLKDDVSFTGSSSPSDSTLHNSPTTDSGSMDSDQFNDQITLFSDKASETLASDDFYAFVDESVNELQKGYDRQQEYVDDIIVNSPIVANMQTHTPKIVKRISPSSNSPKKLIVTKPITHTNQNTHGTKTIINTGKNQVIRVQAGGRSLLLPVNVKDIKKLKVIRANDFNMEGFKLIPAQAKPIFKKAVPYAASTSSESVDEDIDVVDHASDGSYPALELTGEEKRLLMKEGIKLPTHYPLTKYEEKELKRIRRKIRNKISAQDSRKRKKEYVDQLEEKARKTDEENELLKSKVKTLNRENTRLSEQLKKLQELLCSSSSKATPTTCLMIVLFSTLLVCLPNLRTSDNKEIEVGEQQMIAARRALLFNPSKDEEEQTGMDEFLVFNKEEAELRFEEEEKENGTNAFVKYLGELSTKYESIIRSNCSEILQGGSLQDYCKKHEDEFKQAMQDLRLFLEKNSNGEEKKFIEPDIDDDDDNVSFKRRNAYLPDDDDPPTKTIRISNANLEYDTNVIKVSDSKSLLSKSE